MRRLFALVLIGLLAWVPSAQAAVAFVSDAVAAGDPTTSFTATIPTVAVDDILILSFIQRNSGDAGTVVDDDVTGNLWAVCCQGSTTVANRIYWKRATADTSGKTITSAGPALANCMAGVLSVWRGVTTSDPPFEAAAAEANISGNETHAEITTSVNGVMVIFALAIQSFVGLDSAAMNGNAMTLGTQDTSTGGSDCVHRQAYLIQATAGGTGAVTWAMTNSVTESIVFGLLPAATTCVPKMALLGVGNC